MEKLLTGLSAIATAVLLAISAYRYGMFFDTGFYRWEWIVIAACAGSAAGSFVSRLGTRREERLNAEPVPAAAYGLLVVALLYALSLTYQPASFLGTVEQALRWSAYAAFAIALYGRFGRTGAGAERRAWLSAALQTSGVFVLWGALAGWMGWISFPDIVMTTGDERLSAVGARLSGFVQYPNFMGAIAGAYLLFYLILLTRTRSTVEFFAASALAVPAVLALLLTESRGAWLVTAAVWLGGLPVLRKSERTAWLFYSGWTLIGGGAAYRAVVHAGIRGSGGGNASGASGSVMPGSALPSGASAMESMLLIMICAAATAGFLGLRWLLAKDSSKLLSRLAWGGWLAGLAGMVALLPSVLQGRLSGRFQTAGARSLFYQDAWQLFKEAPFLGRGGDAWRMLFTQVQSAPYVGNEVHSGYIEIALDLGIVGLLVFALAGYALLRAVWRSDRIGLLPPAVLLLHAAVDFDMSFGYYWLLLLGWVVYFSSAEPARVNERGVAAAAGAAAPRRRRRAQAPRHGWLRPAMLAAAAAGLAAAAVLGVRLDRAVQYRDAAAAASGTAQAAALRAALESNPYWTRIRLELAPLAPPPERAVLLAAGLRYEPQSVPLLWALGQLAAERSDVRGAAHDLRLALRYDRFDRDKQTEAVVTMTQLAEGMRAAQRLAEARLAAETAVAFFDAYEAQRLSPGVNGRQFAVTKEAKAAAERSRLLLRQLGGVPQA
ncbi:O-antigen ligase family protein [Paenibacillus montanisoli]|uniref:O-antigen ligase-related domain-containing protein n=1 Tax=Paenibacillus montanisoli TaxID=2081970 RepID=A0A328U1K2_9BACL|nr:O-antigen ligase family protein [Paenibacillus montanisoli]RAP75321.1 hypothetical protein DL346_18285 [Paenibacillus montanisoli]